MGPFLVGEIDEYTGTPNPEHIKTIIIRLLQQIKRQYQEQIKRGETDEGP